MGREFNQERLLLVVEVRARFRDKATKKLEVFSLRERWINEGRKTRPGSAQLDLHVAGGQIISPTVAARTHWLCTVSTVQ